MADRKPDAKTTPAPDDSKAAAGPATSTETAPEATKPRRPGRPRTARTATTAKPLRAGGYIDRRDGHGWVLDDTPPAPPPAEPPPKPAPAGPSHAGGWVLPRDEE